MHSRLLSAFRLIVVCTLVPAVAISQVAQSSQPLDRHARKIQKIVASYPPGSPVFVTMRDQSQYLGNLGAISVSTFELVPRKGPTLNLAYSGVDRIQKADYQTSSTIVVRHHHGLIVGLVLAGTIIGLVIFAGIELKKS